MNNFDWLKNNCKLFIDQNVNCEVKDILIKDGFNVESVYDIGYKGANDGKILKILKKEKRILITFDYKFSKMAEKYNHLSILLERKNNQYISNKTITIKIKEYLNINYKKIKHEMSI